MTMSNRSKKQSLAVCISMLIIALSACSFQGQNHSEPNARTQSAVDSEFASIETESSDIEIDSQNGTLLQTLMTDDERAMLQSFYTSEDMPEVITERQQEILTEYRFLRRYLRETYPNTRFRSPQLSPGKESRSKSEQKQPDTFRLFAVNPQTGCAERNIFDVRLDAKRNACEIVYDEYDMKMQRKE